MTLKAGEAVDKRRLTQVGRALRRLGIEHIPAYSPQARGRSERMFSTLQDRLPKELALAGISEIEAANRFIAGVYLPVHNARFATPAAVAERAFVAADPAQLAEILCIEEERIVAATTPSPSAGSSCNCRQARTAITTSRLPSRCGSTRTVRWPSSTARAVSLSTTRTARRGVTKSNSKTPREPLRRKIRSGHMM